MRVGSVRTLALGCLAACLLAMLGSAGDAERGIRLWCEGTARWLGEVRAQAHCAEARRWIASFEGTGPAATLQSTVSRPGPWAAVELAVLRALSLQTWGLLILPLWVAALLDGWLSRRTDAGSRHTYPERAALATRGARGLLGCLPAILAWPMPVPVLVLPVMGLLAAALSWVWVRHRPGEVR